MLEIEQAQVCVLFGFPSKEQMSGLKRWLKEDTSRAGVVLENEPLFDIELPERVRLYWVGKEAVIFKQIAREHLFMTVSFISLKPGGDKIKDQLEEAWQEVHLKASDFQERGLNILANFFGHVTLSPESLLGRGLKGAFSGRAAVICGAGPSLEKEAEKLRKVQDRALILAGGSALSALSHLDISPHMAGYIDPSPPFDRFAKNRAFEVPLFFQSRLLPKITQMHGGPKIWFEGSGLHPIEQWLYCSGSFDGGWNVATFLTAIAFFMGCSQVALVGVDLTFVDGMSYARGVNRGHEKEPIDWKFAVEWLKNYETVSIDALLEKPMWDVKGHVHSVIEQCEWLDINSQKVDELKRSFQQAEHKCIELLRQLEKRFPEDPRESGSYALSQRELEEEVAYQLFLSPVWEVWKDLFAREMPSKVPEAFGIELNKWLFLKGVCHESRKI